MAGSIRGILLASLGLAGIFLGFRMLKTILHYRKESGGFVEVHKDSADSSFLTVYQRDREFKFTVARIPYTEVVELIVDELFAGPDDPRLPSDISSLPIGRREDFVSEFNFWFFFYEKQDDEEYDENRSLDVNRVRFALGRAHASINRQTNDPTGDPADGGQESESESGIPESSLAEGQTLVLESGAIAHRIKEDFVGVVIPHSTQEQEGTGEVDVQVVVIKQGWSLNGRYYGENALENISSFINDDTPGFMNHGNTFGRDPRDWAIMLHTASHQESRVEAKMHIFKFPDGDFLRERVEKAPHLFGGSIDAFALIDEGEAEGREGPIVTEVVRLNSWDIVMFPAAGGEIVGASESIGREEVGHVEFINKEKVMNKQELLEKYPELFKVIVSEAQEDLQKQVVDLTEQNEALAQENRDLSGKLDAIQVAEEKNKKDQEFKATIKELLDKEFSDEEVSERFVAILHEEGPEHLDRCKKLIAERRATLDAAGKGVAESKIGGDNPDRQDAKAATDEDELARFRSRKKTG
jgi:regulator of replication initiation timing